MNRVFASCLLGVMLVLFLIFSASAQTYGQGSGQITLLNQAGNAVTSLTDGDLVRLAIELPEVVSEPITISFYLDKETNHIGDCQIPSGERGCTTISIGTLGWYWNENQEVQPERFIYAIREADSGLQPVAPLGISVRPRPVVLVHGFGSSYTTWEGYLGPSGYLALMGLHGYAVGDGQVTGTLHTGNLLNPTARTNTIAGNAAALGEYIRNVKAETGAEQVDLVVHSMGGLISRYYIDRLMGQRDVAQLVMLGTPNGGSDCTLLAGSLGLYQPAGLELRSSYIRHVFNPQITETHDVPFYIFAGTPIRHGLLSPCSEIPNDLVVSLDSAAAFPAEMVEVPFLHIDLTTSEELFGNYVAPLLRKPGSEFSSRGEQPGGRIKTDRNAVQFSQIYTGMVDSAQGNTHTINIDSDVAVASFGLYDPSRTLTVTVRGASGNVIILDPVRNGLTIFDDPDTLFYLGYGFENPNPGAWQVTVRPTQRTPPQGAEYAFVAHYVGGASIEAELSNYLPGVEEEVEVTATLQLGNEAVVLTNAQVVLHHPDGRAEIMQLSETNEGIQGAWQPQQSGIYGVDVSMSGLLPGGVLVERSTYLAFEAFEDPPEIRQ
jgi:pimeloyl-ACP methyl ester carboxylesterase